MGLEDAVSQGAERLKVGWHRMLSRFSPEPIDCQDARLPRQALFNTDQMEEHGRLLAASHTVGPARGSDRLLTALADNENTLLKACATLTGAVRDNRQMAPAAEWLLDNFYLIEEQIRIAKRHLPRRYSRQLPRLAGGPSAGLPRVYDIAVEAITHGDGRIDLEGLSRFVAAYQSVKPLDLGELWAIPIMLRLALIENLACLGSEVATSASDKGRADGWADWMMGIAVRDPKSLILVVADMARSDPPMAGAFVAELSRRLQGQSAALALPLSWIEQRLAETGLTIETMVQLEAQQQAAGQVSISNSITSLRLLSAVDWRDFVEAMSLVDHCLRQDPAKVYATMDFATRDRYRHAVEFVARWSGKAETAIAQHAVELAAAGLARPLSDYAGSAVLHARAGHVGYYLIDGGRALLEQGLSGRPWGALIRPSGGPLPVAVYLGAIALLTAVFTGLAFPWIQAETSAWWIEAGVLVLVLVAASQLAIALVQWAATLLSTPETLPRLDFSKGIPAGCACLVAVPAMLSDPVSIDALCEAMEVRFLANRDDRLQFALLTDFQDAAAATAPGDEALLERAASAVQQLNLRYPEPGVSRFLLLHRNRSWNAAEGCWMGYERKRGKLAALNALLRGSGSGSFSRVEGGLEGIREIRYVITLDSDTRLPRDAARQFVATMAHPLNVPDFDAERQRVTSGYGILQPRVAVDLPSTRRSPYARIFSSEAGVDPYTRAVSDVYQDLFGEGSFIGKGIYDVDAFEHALAGHFPPNRILSHDLLEGCYARAGLLSDVLLVEAYPADYSADVMRRKRWIRGDWQIASWILPLVPSTPGKAAAGFERNPLTALSRWKILDNLRRSLVAPLLALLLVMAWCVLSRPLLWTLVVLGALVFPLLLATLAGLLQRPRDLRFDLHLAATLGAAGERLTQILFSFACLLHEAGYSMDAILRTCWRVVVSRRRLLEWQVSPPSAPAAPGTLTRSWAGMWPVTVVALGLLVLVGGVAPSALPLAAPILLLWALSPVISYRFSVSRGPREDHLDDAQRAFLGELARRTWLFFETCVTAQDHWLPPDNFQEYPHPLLAHRTSPTNMGLALLANLAAHDLGYIGTTALLERTGNTLAAMDTLVRYRGHFYNWYDTLTLAPLLPLYVSTVDSGNLAGLLLTLQSGLEEFPRGTVLAGRWRNGLQDVLRLYRGMHPAPEPATASLLATIDDQLARLGAVPAVGMITVHELLGGLREAAVALYAHELASGAVALPGTAGAWALALQRQTEAVLEEFALLLPWTRRLPIPELIRQQINDWPVPQLREVALGGAADFLAIRIPDGAPDTEAMRAWIAAACEDCAAAATAASARLRQLAELSALAGSLSPKDYEFLYDRTRHLLAIGFNAAERRSDPSYYDMLASEARLGSFVAIAQGYLPQIHWFSLGRLLTRAGGRAALLSWSGSMFEYLMPVLVMPSYEDTLLDSTCRAAVEAQIRYGIQRQVPWGISESGYNAFDAALNYQYRAFGVPGMGIKPGLAEDLVIAPYATALALMVAPDRACRNLQRLASIGAAGTFGLHEALDYTPARVPGRQSFALVRSFMAHHQGMALLALDSLLAGQPMQRRFTADPMIQATTLLLQERIPRVGMVQLENSEYSGRRALVGANETPARVISTPATAVPVVQLLSNGSYHVMITNAGGGYSQCKELAITRWREDPTRDCWGSFCYLRDVETGTFWSNTFQPTLRVADTYAAILSEGRAEFRRRDLDFTTHTEVVVSPEDNIELRRLHISNGARHARTIEVTSFAEVALADPLGDAISPAFGKLFIETEIDHPRCALLCTRRPRSHDESVPWMLHQLAVRGVDSEVSFETDRSRFIGRGRSPINPEALGACITLSGTAGAVLDPVVAIRHRIRIEPQQTVVVDMVTGVATSRAAALGLVAKYQDVHLADRVFDLAWTHSQVVLRQINASEGDAQLFSMIAGSVLYAGGGLRADPAVLARNRRSQSGLWGYSISGDLPIVLVRISDPANIELVRQLVQAHAYWRLKGLAVDLVIWNEDQAGYRQALQEQIQGLIAAGVEAHVVDKSGGIFLRRSEQMSEEENILMRSVARAIFSDQRGTLAEQVSRRVPLEVRSAWPDALRLRPLRPGAVETARRAPETPAPALLFGNGLGGFLADGSEYVMTVGAGLTTPAPWCNVIANADFGMVVSERGTGCTWSENAQQFRLSPWANDPVSDPAGEVIYLRDEENGQVWSATPAPCPSSAPYTVRHGFGYSVFSHTEAGIATELTVFVGLDSAVKYSTLRIVNESGRPRRISVTAYVEWVLGDIRAKTAMHVVSEMMAPGGALQARNAYHSDFGERVAFLDVDDHPLRTHTADRLEFIGRNGSLASPAALERVRLSNATGAGLDPCGALQIELELLDGAKHDCVFRLGCGRDPADARRLVAADRGVAAAAKILAGVRAYWKHKLGTIRVKTPEPAFDLLANGWLLYQTQACRLWGRSACYQSGGAFGFRDQLQDVMALVHSEPGLTRAHLLRCAARQFREGDVQHWWHPNTGRGVRTRCSDDYLWLALATCRYVQVTGDTSVLDETAGFLDGRPVAPGEDSYFELPVVLAESASLYQHCVRALRHAQPTGRHGLPLMGSGDWNDGMNLVGIGGQGESIWLGFFLHSVLEEFATLAQRFNDAPFAAECRTGAAALAAALETSGWDGAWYLRAFFDDGTPLGSSTNAECQIDAIAQSWAVLSGVAGSVRAGQALESLDRRLVRRDGRLVELLTPPFDKSELEPGYIKGYLPGVRENGGQYTHAAVWTAMAFARVGDAARAWELCQMINPVTHSASEAGMQRYKVEPYVLAADVYTVPPHLGRGGWTWYTGSAGWYWRLLVESLMGLQREGTRLRFVPCLPEDWPGCEMDYRFVETTYHIRFRRAAAAGFTLDGVAVQGGWIELADDRHDHVIEVLLLRAGVTPPAAVSAVGSDS